MSLEDEFSDVIAKAMKGLEIEVEDLAKKTGVSPCEISGLLHGDMEEDTVRRISPVLGLDADAVIALPSYLPAPMEISGVRRIELPFRQWTVNAWQIRKGDTCLLFDTGFGDRDVLAEINTAETDAVLITHDHPDHVGGAAALEAEGVIIISAKEAMGKGELHFGNGISVRVLDLSGHMDPAVGYLIGGFGTPMFVVGDAVFAGSMGGWKSRKAYDLAFETLREAFADMPDDCVILPGHGPATTLEEENVSNPFLKEWQMEGRTLVRHGFRE